MGAPRAQTCAKGISSLWNPSGRTCLITLSGNFRQFSLWRAAKSRLGPMKKPGAVRSEQAPSAVSRLFRAWSARKMIQWIIFSGKRAGRPRNLLRNPRPAARADPRLACVVYQTYLQPCSRNEVDNLEYDLTDSNCRFNSNTHSLIHISIFLTLGQSILC